jgi:predicted N-acetyltransferase YhbS
MQIRQMQCSDVPFCDELRRLVGWNQLPEDWALFLRLSPTGCFVAELEGRIAGTVTTIQYEKKIGWIGMLIVHPERRGLGVGSQLLKRAIEFLRAEGVPSIKLDATPEGAPLYVKMGFRKKFQIIRWFRTMVSSLEGDESPDIRSATHDDLPDISRLDELSFGANRLELLQGLRDHAFRTAVSTQDKNCAAFAMLRRGANANYLGPFTAPNEIVARKLVNAMFTKISPVIWDLPGLPDHSYLAKELGFAPARTLVRMTLGESLPAQRPERYWGLADPAVG